MHSQQRGFYGERGGVFYNRCVKVAVPQVFTPVSGCFRGRRSGVSVRRDGGEVGERREESHGGCEQGENVETRVFSNEVPQVIYNYDSPDVVVRRKRVFPVQIPIQAIHFNEE